MSLTSAEWKLLHRVIDLVDERRAAPVEGADVQRVKSLVLDVYRDQGIGVDEAVVEQAIRDAAGPNPIAAGATMKEAVPSKEIGALQKAELQWQAAERARADERWQQELRTNPIARLNASIEREAAPLIAHRPISDADLNASMAQAMVREVMIFRRFGRASAGAWGVALAGLGIFGWQTHQLTNGTGSFLAMLGGFIMMTAGRGAWLLRKRRSESGADTLALMRGQTALAAGDYDNADLKKGAVISGHIVRGSLKPVEQAALGAAHRRARVIAGDDRVVLQAWEAWDFDHAPMRENDLLVLQALRGVRRRHPFHSIKRLRDMAARKR